MNGSFLKQTIFLKIHLLGTAKNWNYPQSYMRSISFKNRIFRAFPQKAIPTVLPPPQHIAISLSICLLCYCNHPRCPFIHDVICIIPRWKATNHWALGINQQDAENDDIFKAIDKKRLRGESDTFYKAVSQFFPGPRYRIWKLALFSHYSQDLNCSSFQFCSKFFWFLTFFL